MRLINTDGMAFIGPGSEWFWTAVSGLVLAVTFFAIYRQAMRTAGPAGTTHRARVPTAAQTEAWSDRCR